MQAWGAFTDWLSTAGDTASATYNSAVNSLTKAMSDLSTKAEGWSMEWQAAVDNLKMKAQEFQRVFSELQADAANVPADLKSSYDSLMSRGNWVKAQIQSITNGIDFGFNMFSQTPLMNGVRQMGGLNSLGILPLIPIAIITGGLAVIVAWLADAYTMQQKINIAKQTKANASQVAQILGAGSSSFGANFFTSAGTMLLIGVGVMLFWPTISKSISGALNK